MCSCGRGVERSLCGNQTGTRLFMYLGFIEAAIMSLIFYIWRGPVAVGNRGRPKPDQN